jgi:hypothetical protein
MKVKAPKMRAGDHSRIKKEPEIRGMVMHTRIILWYKLKLNITAY